MSHSGEIAVVAIACGQEVGVDVELICDPVPKPGAIRSYCSRRELAEIDALAGPDQAAMFYRIWTRKEALLKATGEGLGGLSPDLEVCSGSYLWRHGKTWHLHDLDLLPRYAAAIAFESPAGASRRKRGRPFKYCQPSGTSPMISVHLDGRRTHHRSPAPDFYLSLIDGLHPRQVFTVRQLLAP